MLEKILNKLKTKTYGFYVGVASVVLGLLALFCYLGMGRSDFTGWVVAGLLVGVVAGIVTLVLNIDLIYVASYVCYVFAFYHFAVKEVELRMDDLVVADIGVWRLDGMFYVVTIFLLCAIITAIVASCLKQEKTPPAETAEEEPVEAK